MHVASEFYYWTPAVFGAKPSPVVEANKAGFEKFEKMSSKPEVLKHLKEGSPTVGARAVQAWRIPRSPGSRRPSDRTGRSSR